MKRLTVMVSLAVVWLVSPSSAQRTDGLDRLSSGSARRAGRVRSAPRMHPIRALLLKRVDGVSWDEAPLSDVFDWLGAQSTEHGKVNIVVRWRALEGESIDRDAVVTLQMDDTTVKDVLDEVLDQLSDDEPLTYLGQGNMLRISTKTDFDRKLYVRTYDISDILIRVRNFRGSPQIDLQQQQQSSGGGGGGAGGQAQVQSIFSGQGGGGGDDDDDEDEDDGERADEVMEWIRAVVEPESWQENAGLGTMKVINNQLTVRNTLTVHELLGGPFHLDE